ncbi:hypothetical protein GALMADRAFT_147054 [Galerina marginata CBS 339.88]|uniref:Uncharacterized protein n=1 Tax=Galerina marginata (strain CBS 339.88) TaxID=685588 RepID=A0A067S9D7_GALM3|nr:hypothetical protein GALMADRAFT_147054 [Galerina marginata CBS 339.88]
MLSLSHQSPPPPHQLPLTLAVKYTFTLKPAMPVDDKSANLFAEFNFIIEHTHSPSTRTTMTVRMHFYSHDARGLIPRAPKAEIVK